MVLVPIVRQPRRQHKGERPQHAPFAYGINHVSEHLDRRRVGPTLTGVADSRHNRGVAAAMTCSIPGSRSTTEEAEEAGTVGCECWHDDLGAELAGDPDVGERQPLDEWKVGVH